MGDHVEDFRQRLRRTRRGARDVQDKALSQRSRDAPREPAKRADSPHRLGETRCLAVHDAQRRFGRQVSGGEPGASRGDDEPAEALSHLDECGGDRFDPVGNGPPLEHLEATLSEQVGERRPGAVLSVPRVHGLRDGEDLRAKCHAG